MIIKNAGVFMPEGRFIRCDLRFSERITEVGSFSEGDIDALGLYLVPGFIDIHTHGCMGCDFGSGAAEEASLYLARHGVTSYLAAVMTAETNAMKQAVAKLSRYRAGECGSQCLGVFMEGPFLSKNKRGAQPMPWLASPDSVLFDEIEAQSGGFVKLVTVAPELPGAYDFIQHASKSCTVALGHSDCDYDCALRGFRNGATLLTHMFNGMNPLLHRAPGPIAAAMDADAYAELICDGRHVYEPAVRGAFRLFPDRVVLVSDSLPCAGLAAAQYRLADMELDVRKDACYIAGTDTLAGSVITVYDCVKNAVKFGIPLETAITAATYNPAAVLGLEAERGSIVKGAAADFVLLDRDLNIHSVILRGKVLPQAAAPLL